VKLRYPATARNRDPILAVLREILPATGRVLEVASGSGEHVAYFARAFPELTFQPSDPSAEARASIDAWQQAEDLDNVASAIELDVTATWPIDEVDAILCINMVHISPWEATLGLLSGASERLCAGAPLFLYGPYIVDAETAPSNRDFDASLRSRNPAWGVRELRDIEREADARGLALERTVGMPANNLSVILRRRPFGVGPLGAS
jgi:hypothetical protein